jgi:hypothetical protein
MNSSTASARSYTMKESCKVADKATFAITQWLQSRKDFISIENVEDNREYQLKDIDLVLTRESGTSTIEIKGDTYYRTGNYFFETVSNSSKNTPGCFMYTEADYLFYYFVDERELHILPMKATRKWFLLNVESFKERSTSTSVGSGSYKTIGKLVPRSDVLSNVEGCKVVRI